MKAKIEHNGKRIIRISGMFKAKDCKKYFKELKEAI